MTENQPGLQRPILPGDVNFPVVLAPMVGLTHVALRKLVKSYLPMGASTFWPTEMLNSRRLPGEALGKTPETYRHDDEDVLVPQILGNEERSISLSMAKLQDWGVKGVDINMGCPVKKALKHNYGVALMGDAEYAADVVRMTVKNSKVPVSVKLRAVNKVDKEPLLKFVNGLERAGASWICLHPRTAEQKRRGKADWSQIKWLRERMELPLIGNGDVQCVEDLEALFAATDCDMAMIGRGLAARPWMLWQWAEQYGWEAPEGRDGLAPRTPEEEGAEYGRAQKQLLKYFREYFSESLGVRRYKFYVRMTHMWLTYGHAWHKGVLNCSSYDELENFISSFFSRTHTMVKRTQLRF